MEPNVPTREQLVQEIDELRLRVQDLESLAEDGKRMREELRMSEERFRAIVQASPLATISMDPEGAVTLWNSAAEQIYGWSEEEVLGKPFPYATEEIRGEQQALRERVLSGEAFSEVNVRRRKKDGTPIDLSVSTVPLRDSGGHIHGILSFSGDITKCMEEQGALQEREDRLNLMLNGSPAVIYTCLSTGDYPATFVSDNVQSLLGYRASEFIEDPSFWINHIHPDDRERVLRGIKTQFSGDIYAHEYRFRHLDGTYRWVRDETRRLRDTSDRPKEMIGYWVDMTERHRAVEELENSKERMSQALMAANAGAWEWNMRTNQAVWSDENYRILGLEPGSVEPKYENWLAAVHPEDRGAADRLVTEATQGRRDLDIIFRVVWPDDSIHWINDRGRLVLDRAGEPAGMYGIQIDITDRMRTELALKESDRNYREIFNSTQDAIFIHDAETGAILDMNQGMLDMYGYFREELFQVKVADLSLGSPPFDHHHALEWVRKSILEGPQRFDWMARRKNGDIFWVEVMLKRIEIGGVNRVLSVVRDVDERRRNQEMIRQKEEYFRSLFENSMDIVTIMGPDGTILFESPSVLRVVGFKPEDLIGRNAFTLIHPEDVGSVREAFERLVQSPGSLPTAEFRFQHRDGSWRILDAIGNNLLHLPSVGAIVVNLRDVTEKRYAEQQLKTSLKERELLFKEVHHRVKNNLQIISSLLDLQAGHVENPEVLGACKESSQRVKIMAMIHERLYRPDNLSATATSGYLQDLVQSIVEVNCPTGSVAAQFDGPAIPLDISSTVPCGLIVNELVTNCLKHAFAKDRTGTIKVSVRSSEKKTVTLIVEDDGRGFPADLRIDHVRSLGLNIVKALVRQLNGTIEIQRGAGTQVRIVFPYKS